MNDCCRGVLQELSDELVSIRATVAGFGEVAHFFVEEDRKIEVTVSAEGALLSLNAIQEMIDDRLKEEPEEDEEP